MIPVFTQTMTLKGFGKRAMFDAHSSRYGIKIKRTLICTEQCYYLEVHSEFF
jgi:hypothetical protein